MPSTMAGVRNTSISCESLKPLCCANATSQARDLIIVVADSCGPRKTRIGLSVKLFGESPPSDVTVLRDWGRNWLAEGAHCRAGRNRNQ